ADTSSRSLPDPLARSDLMQLGRAAVERVVDPPDREIADRPRKGGAVTPSQLGDLGRARRRIRARRAAAREDEVVHPARRLEVHAGEPLRSHLEPRLLGYLAHRRRVGALLDLAGASGDL